ncbi:MAG: methionine aminopeptidase [Phycisphaerae bacterium]|jgi:methionyl aminopeptidase|nr:MAG: methionine aminopeptidase [Phycisphaerae bacterium]
MPIIIKSRHEIEMMRRCGYIGHHILRKMAKAVRPGITTAELNQIARIELQKAGAIGLSKNYPTYKPNEGYPAETCISVNEEIVHGIPGPRRLKEGDVVTLDIAPAVDGYCADTAITVPVGTISPENEKLLRITKEALDLALSLIKPGKLWSEIARLIQHKVESNGFNVVREFVGHGVGKRMHEDPKVPNFMTAEQLRSDFKLRPGMTLAVEPMVVSGDREVEQLEDNWTIVTADRSFAAHFEHTVAVTENGCDVLTDGRAPWGI